MAYKLKGVHSDPEIVSGAPVFKGTRITVKNFFDYLEEGESIDDFLEIFSYLDREQVIEVLDIARDAVDNIIRNNTRKKTEHEIIA